MGSIHMPKRSWNQVKAASNAIKKGLYGQHQQFGRICCIACWLYCILLYQPFLIFPSMGNVWALIFSLFGILQSIQKLIWSSKRSKIDQSQLDQKGQHFQFPNLFLLFVLGNYHYFLSFIYLFSGKLTLYSFLQIGQFRPLTLFTIEACHSCPYLHFHHTFLLDLAKYVDGKFVFFS